MNHPDDNALPTDPSAIDVVIDGAAPERVEISAICVATTQAGSNAQYVFVDRSGHWDTPIQLQQAGCGR